MIKKEKEQILHNDLDQKVSKRGFSSELLTLLTLLKFMNKEKSLK